MAENRVKWGLKNVHYALLTEAANTLPSWGTPVSVPGAVSIELNSENAKSTFYADNIPYYETEKNNGYSGSLTIARVPNQMLKDVWGFTEHTTDKTLGESSEAKRKAFALLFQIDGDENNTLYVFYRCFASRPSISSETTSEDNADPTTDELELTIMPVIDPTKTALDGMISNRTKEDTTSTVKAGWFSAVYTGLPAPDPEES